MSDGGGSSSGGPGDSGGAGSSSKGGGASAGSGDKGGGGASGTSLAEGPSGPPSQNTVGASVGANNTPMFQLAGGQFSAGDGSQPLALGSSPSGGSSTASMGNPLGFSSPAAAAGPSAAGPSGAGPLDFTSEFDPLGGSSNITQGAGAAAAAPGTTPLTPEQLGQRSTPAAGARAPAAAPAAGGNSVLESLGIKNPLGAAVGAAGLGYSMMQGQQPPAFSPEMQAQAARLDANGQKLMSYLQSGNLPPGLQASLTQATAAAKAKIISNFAAQGMNTDPTQNTALAAQLAQVDQQALISTAQMGQQLMQSGLAQSGLSSDLYKTLANIDATQTANIGKSIAAFAAAMSGGGTNIRLG